LGHLQTNWKIYSQREEIKLLVIQIQLQQSWFLRLRKVHLIVKIRRLRKESTVSDTNTKT